MNPNLTSLLQLASPLLPVGAFSYSQGLESAIDSDLVKDETSMRRWLVHGLRDVLARYEAPVWVRLYRAIQRQDQVAFAGWNEEFLASRESLELRAETAQMGFSLGRLLGSLQHALPLPLTSLSYPAAHAFTCHCWDIKAEDGLGVYLYGWCENQVSCALKAIPIGQTAGQRLLIQTRPILAEAIETAMNLTDDDLNSQNPMLAILASQHESQYSRLFRS
ncbi:MAG: urease accessory protein UreF [Panacagrimonas sp.]